MVYDALRGDGRSSPATTRHVPRATGWSSLPKQGRWLLLGVVLAGPVGFLIARGTGETPPSQVAKQATIPTTTEEPAASVQAPSGTPLATTSARTAPAPSATPIKGAAAQIEEERPAIAPLPAITLAERPAQAPSPAPPTAAALPSVAPTKQATELPSPVPSGGSASIPAPSPALQSQNTSQLKISVSQAPIAITKTASDGGGEPDPQQVKAALSRLQAAVAAGDEQISSSTLSELQALLPTNSLTLLRARALAAHGSGDLDAAVRYYRSILQRVPEDEQAGVNLALIDARQGDIGAARERLSRMSSRNVDSQMISRAQAELERPQP